MDKQEARHVQSMARKIIPYAQKIVLLMSQIDCSTIRELETMPLENAINRFQNDVGYGIADNIEAIEQVIKDMLPELKPDTNDTKQAPNKAEWLNNPDNW